MSMKALVGHHVSRKFKVDIVYRKRRKFIKINVTDELNEDEFEEIYQENENPFGKYEFKDVYETFNAAMEIGTPNVFKVYEENGLCKILIAKEKDMELPEFILRPTAGPCVQTYMKYRRQQKLIKKGQNPKNDEQNDDNDQDNDDDEKEKDQPKVFKNKMPLAQPQTINKKD